MMTGVGGMLHHKMPEVKMPGIRPHLPNTTRPSSANSAPGQVNNLPGQMRGLHTVLLYLLELLTINRRCFHNHKAPTKALSWLKAPHPYTQARICCNSKAEYSGYTLGPN